MKNKNLLGLLLVLPFLARCGSEDAVFDADADAEPDVVVEDIADIFTEEDVDVPGDEISDPPGDEVTDTIGDTPLDGSDCPSPPPCDSPLITGIENAVDESGCATGYCCTGIEVVFEGVTVTSRAELAMQGSGTVQNIGEVAVVYSDLDCEIRNPVDDSLVASCETLMLVTETSLDVDQSQVFDLAPVCAIEGTEPCFDPVDVVCTFTWETIGCYSSGSADVAVTVDFNCGV